MRSGSPSSVPTASGAGASAKGMLQIALGAAAGAFVAARVSRNGLLLGAGIAYALWRKRSRPTPESSPHPAHACRAPSRRSAHRVEPPLSVSVTALEPAPTPEDWLPEIAAPAADAYSPAPLIPPSSKVSPPTSGELEDSMAWLPMPGDPQASPSSPSSTTTPPFDPWQDLRAALAPVGPLPALEAKPVVRQPGPPPFPESPSLTRPSPQTAATNTSPLPPALKHPVPPANLAESVCPPTSPLIQDAPAGMGALPDIIEIPASSNLSPGLFTQPFQKLSSAPALQSPPPFPVSWNEDTARSPVPLIPPSAKPQTFPQPSAKPQTFPQPSAKPQTFPQPSAPETKPDPQSPGAAKPDAESDAESKARARRTFLDWLRDSE